MPQPLVSVLIPAFNAAPTIGPAIESVVAQSYQHWETIVVDDGSSDRTYEVACGYSDPRIRVVKQDRGGVSAARNRAVSESRGELLAFLDADDLHLPGKLTAQVGLLAAREDVGSTYCWHYRTDSEGKPWTVHTPPDRLDADDFLRGFPFNPSCHMVRRRWHEAVGGFREHFSINEDRDYWLRLVQAGCRFAGTEGIHVHYRLRPPGHGGDFARAVAQALEVIRPFEAQHPEAAAAARFGAFQEYALQSAVSGDSITAQACRSAMLLECPRLFDDRNQRDDFLQAIVDLATRTRGNPEPILERIFDEFTGEWAVLRPERAWASASARIQCGVRELLWTDAVSAAQAKGAKLDERTCRLLRHQLVQARRAFGAEMWKKRRQSIAAYLSELDSASNAERLLNSVDPPDTRASAWTRLKGALLR